MTAPTTPSADTADVMTDPATDPGEAGSSDAITATAVHIERGGVGRATAD